MNHKFINLFKNFSYALTSNIVAISISIIVTLIIPKLVGVNEYGYFQLYLFYSSYVGFLHFGWNDGIYLRYGGKDYETLDKGIFFSQFYMLTILQLIIVAGMLLGLNIFQIDANRIFIFEMLALCMVITNLRTMLLYILQATNRIKEYAKIITTDRTLYLIFILAFLSFGIRSYQFMILADLAAKIISLIYAVYYCKEIVFKRISKFAFQFMEVYENVSVGSKLMFANIASLLIIGIVRFGIEQSWGVATFGKVSLTLSISNLLMTFIGAIGLVLFPVLRRLDEKKLPGIYYALRNVLMAVLFFFLILYYPAKQILEQWLPKYSDSIKYMAILFPVCLYEGKMSLLINTYLKTLRKEKVLLNVNFTVLILSAMATFVTAVLIKNLDTAIISIVIILALRCVLAEACLSKVLKIPVFQDIILELIMTVLFISFGWFLNSWITFVLNALCYLLYLFIKRKSLISTLKNIKVLTTG